MSIHDGVGIGGGGGAGIRSGSRHNAVGESVQAVIDGGDGLVCGPYANVKELVPAGTSKFVERTSLILNE